MFLCPPFSPLLCSAPSDYPDDPNEEILTSLSRLKFPPTEPSSKDYGQALLKQRQSFQERQPASRPPSMGQMRGHPPAEALSNDVSGWIQRVGLAGWLLLVGGNVACAVLLCIFCCGRYSREQSRETR